MTETKTISISGREVHPAGKAVVVFGGAGFIGSHLLRRLASEGIGKLYSVDIRNPKIRVPGVTYVFGDVRNLTDFSVPDAVGAIYNLAAVHTTPGHANHEYYETNIQGATEVTAYARRAGVDSIVFTSSISVYGPSEDVKTEDTPPDPESAYGWSKWLAEGVHRSWLSEQPSRQLIITRPAVIFGHAEGGNFTRLAKLMRGGLFVYPGRKDTVKACFYVEDLIDALFYARSLKVRSVLFNAAYPDHYTIEEIVKTFKAVHFPKAREVLVPRWVVMTAARLLRPLALFNLGIHPDRVLKLVRSTDVLPLWLLNHGAVRRGMLASAFARWSADTLGTFDNLGVEHVEMLRRAQDRQSVLGDEAGQTAQMQTAGAAQEAAGAGSAMFMDQPGAGQGERQKAGFAQPEAEIDILHIEEEAGVHAAYGVEGAAPSKKSAA
ncbi:NAD(P)-dependent oxidoreductase [Rhizobium sp. G21]|uniref:NAD-dependent epimerase/dehydratase family protein n=1 Tax=Rhizobium sp. G21 TaxID=2758439 RepID=UPI001FEE645A|nr:NAD(P)-dependent oxidoreductase [Rhizobium sp. G21]